MRPWRRILKTTRGWRHEWRRWPKERAQTESSPGRACFSKVEDDELETPTFRLAAAAPHMRVNIFPTLRDVGGGALGWTLEQASSSMVL